MEEARKYKLITANGAAAVIISRKKVLLLKRRNLPFLKNAGAWSFLFGHREKNERYLETAYREIKEEVGFGKEALTLLEEGFRVSIFDPKKKIKWHNMMFIFRSDSSEVNMDFENAAYRWSSISEIRRHIRYTNIFIDEERILKRISRYVR